MALGRPAGVELVRVATEQQGAASPIVLHGFEFAFPPGHVNFCYLDEAVGETIRVAYLSSDDLPGVWEKLDAWLPV